MIAVAFFIALLLLISLGSPIGFAMAIVGGLGLLWAGGTDALVIMLGSMPRESAVVYEFVTIPMFLLMAEFVLRSGVTDDLFKAGAAWFGRIPGGLGIATAFSGAGFGAICGSSSAAAATLSATSLPAMLKHGYEPRLAGGCVAISGTLAMLIPPSIAMVVYGLIAEVNIGRLLMAGVVPGILVTLTIVITVYTLVKLDPSRAPLSEPVALTEKLRLLKSVLPVLLLFAAITGVIYTGIATPTEASALGALLAGVLYVARGRASLPDLQVLVARAARTSCMFAIIILGAKLFAMVFALTHVTQDLIAWVGALDVSPWTIMLGLVLLYLVLGFFMDQMAILVLTVPIVAPLVSSLGFDLVWFGIIMIVVAEIGMVTPPVGLNCFIVSKYSKTPVSQIFRGSFPYVVTQLIAIAILLVFPQLTLWLPQNM
ncbi:TRAP transporter large permease [Pseudomonas putida]|uniref:TRAP transporter large permease n=1 Tax=Pseudomonas putida TaxID=303 RepID=UPI001F5270D1|nr:TRAP transporter large permease [Pseudomonas putida]MCI1025779.1 TRAP transporter large permease [Pseudomonas putida]